MLRGLKPCLNVSVYACPVRHLVVKPVKSSHTASFIWWIETEVLQSRDRYSNDHANRSWAKYYSSKVTGSRRVARRASRSATRCFPWTRFLFHILFPLKVRLESVSLGPESSFLTQRDPFLMLSAAAAPPLPTAAAAKKMSRRQKLEELRANRAAGKTRLSTYQIVEEQDVYEEVDEESYRKLVRERLDRDDFVINDNGDGYADDGREDWFHERRASESQSDDDDEDHHLHTLVKNGNEAFPLFWLPEGILFPPYSRHMADVESSKVNGSMARIGGNKKRSIRESVNS